jgi:hypothetical protein
MGVRKIGEKFYIFFNWKGNRIQTVTSASTETEAKKLEKHVKTAFYIYRFDHLEPKALEVTLKIFEIKKRKLPDELSTPEPERELTLLQGIRDYLDAAGKNRTERKMFSLDRIVEYFGENTALESTTIKFLSRST